MAKNHKNTRLNTVSTGTEAIIHIMIGLFSLCCIIPFIFVIIIAFSSEQSIREIGYSFWPTQWSTATFAYAFGKLPQIWRSFFNSVFITVVGTLASTTMCALYSYALYRPDFKFRNFFTFFSFFTMIFGGESRDPKAVREKITAAILDAQKNGLDETMFTECKKTTYGNLVREQNNVSAVTNALVASHMAGCGLYDTMQVLSEMTLEDCNCFLREEVDVERMTLSIIAPAK